MKKHIKIILALIATLTVVLSTAFISKADFGGFAGNSDYGGGGGGSDFSFDDYSYDYSYDSDYSSSSIDDPIAVGVIFVVFIIIFLVVKVKLGNMSKNMNRRTIQPGAQQTPSSQLKPMSDFKTLDPNFSEAAYIEKISNMYVQFQNQWQAKDLEPLRGDMTDAFYAQMDRQLEQLRKANQTNMVENIAVLGVELRGFMQDDVNDTIVATVRTRINDYYVDDNTGAVVRGNKDAEKFMTYEWTMIRRKGVLTEVGEEGESKAQNCPNCGAPLNVNHSAKCEYCGTVITNSDYDWVLSSIKGISQRTSL